MDGENTQDNVSTPVETQEVSSEDGTQEMPSSDGEGQDQVNDTVSD